MLTITRRLAGHFLLENLPRLPGDLIQRAEQLRDALREVLAKTSDLVKSLKQHRRENRSVVRTIESLRQLRNLGV